MAVVNRMSALLGILLVAAACEAGASEPERRAVMGLPVITVSEALSMRSELAESNPIAVSGWYSIGPRHSCPAPIDERARNPLAMDCQRGEEVIAEQPESAVIVQRTVAGDMTSMTVSVREPESPYLFPLQDGPVGADPFGGRDSWIPVPVVAIGHFNDHRAADCPPADAEFCAGVFVLDRIAEADGNELDVVLQGDPGLGPAARSVDEVVQLIEAGFGKDAQLVSLQAVRGQDLAVLEDRAPEMPALAVAWLVELVDFGTDGTGAPELVTVLIADGAADIMWTSRD